MEGKVPKVGRPSILNFDITGDVTGDATQADVTKGAVSDIEAEEIGNR